MASGPCTVTMNWDTFIRVHEQQLNSIGLPRDLWRELHTKLSSNQIHGTDSSFELHQDEGGRYSLHAKQILQRESRVFVFDHAWTSDGSTDAKKQLDKSPELVAKLHDLLSLGHGGDEPGKKKMIDYLDNVEVLVKVGGVDEEKARKSLEENNNDLLESLCVLNHEDYKNNKAPAGFPEEPQQQPLTFEEFKMGFLQTVGAEREGYLSEEYIKKMYDRYLREKEGYVESVLGRGQTAHYSWTEEEDNTICVHVAIPARTKKKDLVNKLTSKKWTFGIKGKEPIVDGYFHDTISPSDSFWTIDSPGIVQMQLELPEHGEHTPWPVLLKGEKKLTEEEIVQQATQQDLEKSDKIAEVMEQMWRYNQTYRAVMATGGTQESVWYIMDKFGSAIKHSDHPNLKCSPFSYAATGTIFSIIWPIGDLAKGEMCTRNACPMLAPTESGLQRQARALAFQFDAPEEIPAAFLKQMAEAASLPKPHDVPINITPPRDRDDNSLPMMLALKVYLDHPDTEVQSVLKQAGCQVVASPKDADAVWISGSFIPDDYTAQQKANRCSGEEYLLERHLLSRLVQERFGAVPWFPVVYDLCTQLAVVHADHHLGGFPSYWVVRSANPSRFAMKPIISSNLTRISRLVETGPVVATKLFLQTAVCQKRNFCLQYTVLLNSCKGPVLLVHPIPNIRLAAALYNAEELVDEYDSSAILSSGKIATTGKKITFDEFLKDFTKDYMKKRNLMWDEVQTKILQSITKVFIAASPVLPETNRCGVYGVDVLLTEHLEPVIIGVDPVPSFASELCMQEVLCLIYSKGGLPTNSQLHRFFRASTAAEQT